MRLCNHFILVFAIFSPAWALQVTASVDRSRCTINDLITFKIEAEDASSFPTAEIQALSKDFSIISAVDQWHHD